MTTIDRLNELRRFYGHRPVVLGEVYYTESSMSTFHQRGMHDEIDFLDCCAGIMTGSQLLNGRLVEGTPVGARLRRHETHRRMKETPPYFWLGSAAERIAA